MYQRNEFISTVLTRQHLSIPLAQTVPIQSNTYVKNNDARVMYEKHGILSPSGSV